MPFTPPNRPVPSPAALRALAQLAYISSGACLGLATLVAEERRRRIKVVQRLAENGRVLRGHPRRRGNVAAVAARVDEEEERGREGEGEGKEVVKNAVLPSVVEEGYERVFGEGRGRVRRRGRRKGGDAEGSGGGGEEEAVKSAVLVSGVGDGYERDFGEGRRVRVKRRQAGGMDGESGPTHTEEVMVAMGEDASPEPKSATSYAPFVSLSEATAQLANDAASTAETDPLSPHDDLDMRSYKRDRRGILSAPARDRFAWTYKDSHPHSYNHYSPPKFVENSPEEESAKIVDRFFARAASVPDGHAPAKKQVMLASSYLVHALENRSFASVRSLFLWKLKTKSLSSADVLHLVHRKNLFGNELDDRDILEFYLEVFNTEAYRALDARVKFKAQLSFLAKLLSHYHEYDHAELESIVRFPDAEEMEQKDYSDGIEAVIRTLLAENKTASAAQLYLQLRTCRTALCPGWKEQAAFVSSIRSYEKSTDLLPTLIDACLIEGHMSLAQHLLYLAPLAEVHLIRPKMNERLAKFIKLCGRQQNYALLTSLFAADEARVSYLQTVVDSLGQSEKEILAIALTKHPRHLVAFHRVYDSLSTQRRASVHEAATVTAIKTDWRQTRNLNLVEAEMSANRKWLIDAKDDTSLRKLDEALVEIYVAAGQLESALKLLSHLSGPGIIDSRIISLTGLMLAKKGDWGGLARLQQYAIESKEFAWDYEVTGLWDKIAQLYALSHTPAESWTFVQDLVDKLGFTPNYATAMIVLQACVEKEQVDIIPGWLRYLRNVGCNFVMDSKVATQMYTWLWLQRRLKHSRVMWHCYFLQSVIPAFRAEHFKPLLQEAISFDLRNQHEQDISSKNPAEHAKTRLELVQKATEVLPIPGWKSETDDEGLSFTREASVLFADRSSNTTEGVDEFQRADAISTTRDSHEYYENEFLLPELELDHLRSPSQTPELQMGYLPSGSQEPEVPLEADAPLTARTVEHNMLVALSTYHPRKALRIYHNALDPRGLPASPRALEIAIDVSLRLHNDDSSEAERIILNAKEAGMNVTVAAASLIMRRLRHTKTMDTRDAQTVRTMVLEYYKLNQDNGWRISHHVATSAAHKLILNRHPHHAINMLTELHKSDWAAHKPLEIVTLTVLLKGYRQLHSLDGILWVVHHVLNHNLLISRRFIRELKDAFWHVNPNARRMREQSWTPEQLVQLQGVADTCHARRMEQFRKRASLGVKLEWVIKRCVYEQGWRVNIEYGDAVRYLRRGGFEPEEIGLEWLRPEGWEGDGAAESGLETEGGVEALERDERTERVDELSSEGETGVGFGAEKHESKAFPDEAFPDEDVASEDDAYPPGHKPSGTNPPEGEEALEGAYRPF